MGAQLVSDRERIYRGGDHAAAEAMPHQVQSEIGPQTPNRFDQRLNTFDADVPGPRFHQVVGGEIQEMQERGLDSAQHVAEIRGAAERAPTAGARSASVSGASISGPRPKVRGFRSLDGPGIDP